MRDNYMREAQCTMRGCIGVVKVYWDNKGGFKDTECPTCKTLFEPYLETKMRLMKKIDE